MLCASALLLSPAGGAAGSALASAAGDPAAKPRVRIGLVTDLHYADKDTRINRYYRQSDAKLREAVAALNRARVDAVVELGDIVDKAPDAETELRYLKTIEAVYAEVEAKRYYVLGNHCLGNMDKKTFAAHTAMTRPTTTFTRKGVKGIVLDACFTSEGEAYANDEFRWTDSFIPPAQIDWLAKQLAAAKGPCVVFCHQLLEGEDDDKMSNYAVSNAAAVRAVIEKAGNVLAVLQGHHHRNRYRRINDVAYVTLAALVEGDGQANNAYGILDVFEDGSARINGFRQQRDHVIAAR